MRKSILIGVLAALMLFAFTACEAQVPNLPVQGGKDIANITVTSTTVYAGQKYTESVPAVVSIVYKDGTTTDNVAVQLTVTGGTAKAGSNFGTIAYEGLKDSTGKAVDWTVEYQAIAVTDANVTVDEDALKVAYPALSSASTIKGNVSLVYADGYVAPAKKETLSWNAETSTPEKITAVEYTVPAALTGAEEIVKSFDLTITGKTTPVVAAWTQKSDAKNYYFGESVVFTIEGKTAAPESKVVETVTQADFASKFTVTSIVEKISSTETKDLTAIPTTYGLNEITVKAYSNDNPFLSVTVTIPAGNDYVANVTADTIYIPTAFVAEGSITESSFTIYAAYASGETKNYARGSSDYNWSIIKAPAKVPAEGTFDVTFAFKYGKGGTQVGTVTKTVEVGKAVAVPSN